MEPAGTTLELIQAYPLGTLEVCFASDAPNSSLIHRVVAIDSTRERSPLTIRTYNKAGELLLTSIAGLRETTPLLKSFPQLVEPLADGTVPAVEIGKRMYSRSHSAIIVDNHDYKPGRACVITGPGTELSISEYGFNNGTLAAGLVEWLREWHFAPLTAGKTLVAGVDYLEKR